ncbi:zinc-finger of the MIZ type in Nse subunit-domain-containing protein [Chiua virens]|nr:zinc-finger of the MIZ type in Nse subunit-domain-containing protein [Chiua virens]
MPTRTRRVRREPSSDHIEEEDGPSQPHADDVDNDDNSEEDVQPVRKNTVKKEKKPKITRGSTVAPSAVTTDDGEIDIENFHDQPLDKKEGAKLHGIAQDWEMIRKQIHQSSFRLVKDVAMSLADVMEVGEAEGVGVILTCYFLVHRYPASQALDEVDTIMKKLLDIEHEMQSHEESLNNLHQTLMRGEVVDHVLESYETEVQRRLEEYETKTTRQKYASSNTYVEFKQGIFEVQNPGETIPPIGDLVPREDGDPSDDEDELEIGGVTQDYKCPITLVVFENPMTSQVCGHSYSRAAIQEFLKRAGMHGKACPTSGCNKRITMENLKG